MCHSSGPVALAAWTVLIASVVQPARPTAQAIAHKVIRLELVAYGQSEMETSIAARVATDLLASAGIAAVWVPGDREPGANLDCCGAPIQVRLLPVTRTREPETSGEVAQDNRTRAPIVLVYAPRVAEVTRDLRSRGPGRANPRLATLAFGHICGLVIAHEVGHVLGLSHAASGVMKATPGPAEALALRESRLVFRAPEVRRMALALTQWPTIERR
jgi:hypothetical protein